MTSEISSAPELIYYCEFDPENWEDRLEITFSNEHIVILKFLSFKAGEIEIEIDIQLKNLLIPVGFFGDKISNISVIAGKNGVGKSNILKGIFSNRNNAPYESIAIYKPKDLTYLIELSDIKNTFIKSITDARFEMYTTQDPYLEPMTGRYAKEDKKCNSLLIGMNLYSQNLMDEDLSCRKRIPIYQRVLADSRDSEVIELLKDSFFSETFFQKKIFPVLYTTDIVDFYTADYYFYENSTCFCVKSEFLEYSRKNELKELFLFYFLIKNLSILSPNYVSNTLVSEAVELSVKDAITALKRIVRKTEFRYRTCYPNFTHEKYLSDTLIPRIVQLLEDVIDGDLKVIRNRLEYTITDLVYINEGNNLIDCTSMLLNDLDLLNKAVGTKTLGVSVGGYSSGERYIIEQFASLRKVLGNEVIKPDLLMEVRKYNSIIILIDEYEQFLHPEWARRYLESLIQFLEIEGRRLNIQIQIIVTTHSPYLISDLPKENIRLIQKNEKTGRRAVSIPKHGFASNYYDILSDSFFLEDTIGEFAKQKINGWITELNELDESSDSDVEKLTRIDELKALIHIVDDQFIRNKLLGLAEEVKGKIERKDNKDLQKFLLDQQIAELQKQRNALDLEDNDDQVTS